MMNFIKDSKIGKCLQVLLIGYFLMSSINISTSLDGIVSSNSVFHSSHIAGNTLKMIFKCAGCPEEIDDYEAKSGKNSKGLLMLDYFIPAQFCYTKIPGLKLLQKKGCTGAVPLQCKFQGKIHLPPPERIL